MKAECHPESGNGKLLTDKIVLYIVGGPDNTTGTNLVPIVVRVVVGVVVIAVVVIIIVVVVRKKKSPAKVENTENC